MKLPYMSEQCEQMLKITNELVRLQVSYDEYLCMKVLLLLSTGWCRRHASLQLHCRNLTPLPPSPPSPPTPRPALKLKIQVENTS